MRPYRNKTLLIFLALAVVLVLAAFVAGCDDGASPTEEGTDSPADTAGTFKISDFTSAEECKGCHPVQFRQWSGSMHAYASKDPVMIKLNELGQSAYTGALDQGCVKCHAMIGSRAGETPWGEYDPDNLPAVAQEGITCDLCHTISSVRDIRNGEVVLTPGPVKFGTFDHAQPNEAHESEKYGFYKESRYCGSCHDIYLDNGFGLETTYTEWVQGGQALTGKTCNDCHMQSEPGQAAVGGPQRMITNHAMVGVDLAFIEFPEKDEQLRQVTEMLQNALTMNLLMPDSSALGGDLSFSVELINDLTGHNVPSGATFLRQAWLHVVVTDADDDTLFQTGMLDDSLDLFDIYSDAVKADPDLLDSSLFNLQSTMIRADGKTTQMVWDAASLINPTIAPGETSTAEYSFPVPGTATGPLSFEVTLKFRSFPPYVIRSLDLHELLPITIVDMERDSGSTVSLY